MPEILTVESPIAKFAIVRFAVAVVFENFIIVEFEVTLIVELPEKNTVEFTDVLDPTYIPILLTVVIPACNPKLVRFDPTVEFDILTFVWLINVLTVELPTVNTELLVNDVLDLKTALTETLPNKSTT